MMAVEALERVLLDVYQQARVLNDHLALAAGNGASEGSSRHGTRPDRTRREAKVKVGISDLDQLQVIGDPDRLRQPEACFERWPTKPGSTASWQGDRKLSAPAANAMRTEMLDEASRRGRSLISRPIR